MGKKNAPCLPKGLSMSSSAAEEDFTGENVRFDSIFSASSDNKKEGEFGIINFLFIKIIKPCFLLNTFFQSIYLALKKIR